MCPGCTDYFGGTNSPYGCNALDETMTGQELVSLNTNPAGNANSPWKPICMMCGDPDRVTCDHIPSKHRGPWQLPLGETCDQQVSYGTQIMDSITTEAECNHAAAVLGLMDETPPSYARLSPDTPYTYRSGRKCSGDVVSVGDALAAQSDLGQQFFGTDLSAHKWSFGEAVAACDGAPSCTGVVLPGGGSSQEFALCDTTIVDDSYALMRAWEKAWVYTKELDGNYGCPDGGSDAFPDEYPTWREAARACDVSSQCVAIIDHGAQGFTLCSYGAVASNPPFMVAFSAIFSFAIKTVWSKPGHVVAQNGYVRSRAGFKCDSAHLVSSPLYDSNGSPSSFATAAAKCDADPSCGALYDNKDDGVGFFVCVVGFTLEQARALRSDHCHPSHPIL